jgi:hypothetical protein
MLRARCHVGGLQPKHDNALIGSPLQQQQQQQQGQYHHNIKQKKKRVNIMIASIYT